MKRSKRCYNLWDMRYGFNKLNPSGSQLEQIQLSQSLLLLI